MSVIYEQKLNEMKNTWEDFINNAEAGKEGRGSKAASLRARKASMSLSTLMKEYRSVSIENDKS